LNRAMESHGRRRGSRDIAEEEVGGFDMIRTTQR
jgi:hypothetical protein